MSNDGFGPIMLSQILRLYEGTDEPKAQTEHQPKPQAKPYQKYGGMLIPNPAYDPSKPLGENGNNRQIPNPLCVRAGEMCEQLYLPYLEMDSKDKEKRAPAILAALRLIAEHQIPPPPWLAAEMLKDDFPPKARKNAAELTLSKIERAWVVVDEIEKLKTEFEKAGFKFDGVNSNKYTEMLPEKLKSMLAKSRELLKKHGERREIQRLQKLAEERKKYINSLDF